MPQITINAKQVREMSEFAKKHNEDKFFLAKDSGAYIGITAKVGEELKKIIHYFSGCNPDKDEDYYENSRYKFGGDDFGEHLEMAFMHKCAAEPRLKNLTVKVTQSSISMSAKVFKEAPKPQPKPTVNNDIHAKIAADVAAAKAAQKNKGTVGDLIRTLLEDPSMSYDMIVENVKMRFPNAKTSRKSVASTASVMRRKGLHVPKRRG